MRVDCHIHSLHSDGVYTVKEIIAMLLQRNIELFSLTDHDTVDGIKETKRLSKNKIRFVTGIEFTCKEIKIPSIDKVFSIHLLGYNFNEDDSQLLRALNERKENVTNTYEELCRELTSMGYSVLMDEIPISCGNVLQLCDVHHYIKQKYINVRKDVYKIINSYVSKLNHINISVEEAISLIHGAGGKTIWAHPFCVYKDFKKMNLDEKDVLYTLDVLSDAGIDGMEAYYLAFSDKKRKWLYDETVKRNMLYTAGSDFHGSIGRDCMGMEIR